MALNDYLSTQLEEGNKLRQECYRGRYAPSPTGPLHLGNLRTALVSWLRARLAKGVWLLRIDDLDTPRNFPGAVESFQRDLLWLGLNWDGPLIFQSNRRGLYRLTLSALRRQGKLYACRCSRKKVLRNFDPDRKITIYPGTCRKLKLPWGWYEKNLPSLRLKVQEEFANKCGDIVLRRSDGFLAYHLATVVDELTMGITEVVRGEDLKVAYSAQLALTKALSQKPAKYQYAPILCDKTGVKLSKRHGAIGVKDLQDNGVDPSILIGSFAGSLGLLPLGSKLSAKELLVELRKGKKPLASLFNEE